MSPIAIIGFQGRFPGNAKSPSEFFEQLLASKEFSGDVPEDRWSKAAYVTSERAAGKTTTGRGSFLNYDYRGFDVDLIALPADEAAYLDPQQRLVLEVAWEALEQAAIDPLTLSGETVGVYVGGFTTDHLLNQLSAQSRSALGRFSAAGSTLTMLANRLSYALDLRGPSLAVDTACASSLTALAAAVADLQAGACRMALAGGVSFMLRPEYQVAMSAAGLLAVDGRSKPFSNLADGYGRGEGCGMLVLKPLADAYTDNDHIWAVIEAIGTAHSGHTAGISLPNGEAQAALMRRVLAASGLAPTDIGYVEAHGTGTIQGDRTEARSIGWVYGRAVRREPLPIGSVKANIGHLEAAAGIAGVIKALLILQWRGIPPHLLTGYPNPDIPFEALNLRLSREAEALKSPYVAVNAFGYGGSNAHVILGAAPETPPSEPFPVRSGAVMLPLSAQSAEALSSWLPRLAERIEAGGSLVDLQYTLGRRRGHRSFRTAVWVDSRDAPASVAAQVRSALVDGLEGRNSTDGAPRALFVFSGMGPQWAGMGRSLWRAEPVFRDAVEEIDTAFRPLAGFSLVEAMTGNAGPTWGCRVAQPLNFALQVGLVRLLSAYGLDPDICLGHSAGEAAAAYCSGHLRLAQALAVCWARSELQDQRAGGGGMLVAAIEEQASHALCSAVPGLEIAALNARRSIAFTGPERALLEAETQLDSRKLPSRRVPGNIAYHSADMDSILVPLEARLKGLDPLSPAIPLVSSVTGERVALEGMGSTYWPKNVRDPVRFREALVTAFGMGATHCIEIGPRAVLHGAVAQTASDQAHDITVIPTLGGEKDERLAIRKALTRAYVSGAPFDWQRLAPAGKVVCLPATGWHRQRLWHETEVQMQDRTRHEGGSPWAEAAIVPQIWNADLNREVFAFLGDHRIAGVPILPGTAAMEAAVQTALAVREASDAGLPIGLSDICFENPFLLNRRVGQVLDTRHIGGALETLAYDPASPSGAVRVLKAQISCPGRRPAARRIAELAALAPYPLDWEQHHARLVALGIEHGPSFRTVQKLALAADGGAVFAHLAINRPDRTEIGVEAAVCLLDGIFQAALALTVVCEPLVPTSIRSYTVHAPLPRNVWAWINLAPGASDSICFNASLLDAAGECLAELEEIVVRPLTPHRQAGPVPDLSLVMDWRDVPLEAREAQLRRIAVVASSSPERSLLCRALTAAGAVLADNDVDATALLVPDGPQPLAERMADLLAVCTRPFAGRVYLVTRNALAVVPGDVSDAEQAAAWGLGRTLFNEIPETATTMIDVAGEAWYAAVAREIAAACPSSEVALRNGRRLLPQLRAVVLPEVSAAAPGFDKAKTYLITGGVGGLGQQLALWLARRGAGRIIVTSRSLPPQARLAPLARELSKWGADLTAVPLDLADGPAVRALLMRIMSSDAPLGGIFHWAGMAIDRPATIMTAEELRLVLEPKAGGAAALHAASLDLPLDYFVMASSLSAIVGNPRQANYAAANTYLDGLAWARHAACLPALSVNFGAVAGTGIAADPTVLAHLKAAGLPPMRVETAFAGLGAALLSGLPQLSLSLAIDFERWMRYDPRCAGTDKMAGLLTEARAAAGNKRNIRGELSRVPVGSRAKVLADHLRVMLAEILKRPAEQLSRELPLSRMGLDSLSALEFQILIDREFGVSLPITALISGQTLAGIGARISGALANGPE